MVVRFAGAETAETQMRKVSSDNPIVRRATQSEERSRLACGELVLDAARLTATFGGRAVALTPREVSLLAAFMRRPGEELTRAELLSLVWNIDFDPRSNIIDVGVAALRRKLG